MFDTRLGFNFLFALYPNGIRPDSKGCVQLEIAIFWMLTQPLKNSEKNKPVDFSEKFQLLLNQILVSVNFE